MLLSSITESYQNSHDGAKVYFVVDDSDSVDAASLAFLNSVELKGLSIIFASSRDVPASFLKVEIPPLEPEPILSILKDVLNVPLDTGVEARLGQAFVKASNGCGSYAASVATYLKRNRFLEGSKKMRDGGGEIKLNERGLEKLATLSDSIRSHLQSLLDSTTVEVRTSEGEARYKYPDDSLRSSLTPLARSLISSSRPLLYSRTTSASLN